MNSNKICFISVVDDKILYNECVKYIRTMNVPENIEIDIISVTEEKSTAKAYNEAMKSSDAKYKVYLNQGTLIVNKNFIIDILKIFNSDNSIGMMGMIGSETIPISGRWRDANNKFGEIYQLNSDCMQHIKFRDVDGEYKEVKTINDSIMITQYDIDWREDLFDSCYLYDVVQSTEFILNGYKVVVPKQINPWCINGYKIKNSEGEFKKYRDIFWNKYYKKVYPVNKDKICFSCITSLHIFTSYILAKTVYKDNYKILILSNQIKNVVEAYKRIKLSNIWDEVILITENNPKCQLELINWNQVDILHYYSWGSAYNSILFNYISDCTKIILTDEGEMTYVIKESAEQWQKTHNLRKLPIDFNRISQIWLYDKRLFISSINKPLKNIEFKKYIDSDLKYIFCRDLNYIFNYKHKDENCDIVFFDQCLYKSGLLSMKQEKYLLLNIMKALNKLKVVIKRHPTDEIKKYYNYNIITMVYDYDVPSELIYLNDYIKKDKKDKKVYMTYFSTALLSNIYMFKDVKSKYVLLYMLFFKFSKNNNDLGLLIKFIKTIEEVYKIRFIDIISFYELASTVNKLFDKKFNYEILLKEIIDYQNNVVSDLLRY